MAIHTINTRSAVKPNAVTKKPRSVIDLALRRLTEYSACFLSPEWNPLY
jgi:hypothetical protein